MPVPSPVKHIPSVEVPSSSSVQLELNEAVESSRSVKINSAATKIGESRSSALIDYHSSHFRAF